MPFNLGGPELIIVLVIVLIVFGAGKLPNVMRDFGRGVKEFKKAQTVEDEAQAAATAQSTAAPAGAPPANGAATGTAATAATATTRAPETTTRA